MSNDRYEAVRITLPAVMPPITKIEAQRAATRLYHHFFPATRKSKRPIGNRRCWISSMPTSGHSKGWGRLVHDVSHRMFSRQYPHKRPHDPLHSRWEADVAEYVVSKDWLQGGLKPPEKAKPTQEEKRARKLASVEARIKAWTTKARRADTALKKLRAQAKRLSAA